MSQKKWSRERRIKFLEAKKLKTEKELQKENPVPTANSYIAQPAQTDPQERYRKGFIRGRNTTLSDFMRLLADVVRYDQHD